MIRTAAGSEEFPHYLRLISADVVNECEEGGAAVAFSLGWGVRDHEFEFAGYCRRWACICVGAVVWWVRWGTEILVLRVMGIGDGVRVGGGREEEIHVADHVVGRVLDLGLDAMRQRLLVFWD